MAENVESNGILRVEKLCKRYYMGEVEVTALLDATFEILAGEFVVILGHSGSGKSTLLNLIGGMDTPTSGEIYLRGEQISDYGDKKLTEYRKNSVGFVFQFYNIMANLTARENVELATELSADPLDVDEMMRAVGLWERRDHFPAQMSGGEQQRVSIARAIAKNPDILLCDEPTGALDSATGASILALLQRMNREMGKTTVIITHNASIAEIADRVIRIRSGQVVENRINEYPVDAGEIQW